MEPDTEACRWTLTLRILGILLLGWQRVPNARQAPSNRTFSPWLSPLGYPQLSEPLDDAMMETLPLSWRDPGEATDCHGP